MIEMFLAHSETQIKIPLLQLALSLVPLIVVGWISFRWAGKGGEIGIATARMVVQLLAAALEHPHSAHFALACLVK